MSGRFSKRLQSLILIGILVSASFLVLVSNEVSATPSFGTPEISPEYPELPKESSEESIEEGGEEPYEETPPPPPLDPIETQFESEEQPPNPPPPPPPPID